MKSFTYTCDYCKEDIGTEPNVKKGSIFIDHIDITLNNERDKRYLVITDTDNIDGSMSLHFCSLKCFLRFLYFDPRSNGCSDMNYKEKEINYLKALEDVLGNEELTVLLVKIDSLEGDIENLWSTIDKLKKERRELRKELEQLKGETDNAQDNNNA